jgi:hypothetical protein
LKRSWPEKKSNETEEEIEAEARELSERSSRSQSKRLERIIINLKKGEVIRKDNTKEETLFLEEEEEVEKVNSYVMLVERQDTCLGNALRERNKEEEKNTFLKLIRMWKQKQQKEEETL